MESHVEFLESESQGIRLFVWSINLLNHQAHVTWSISWMFSSGQQWWWPMRLHSCGSMGETLSFFLKKRELMVAFKGDFLGVLFSVWYTIILLMLGVKSKKPISTNDISTKKTNEGGGAYIVETKSYIFLILRTASSVLFFLSWDQDIYMLRSFPILIWTWHCRRSLSI